MPNPFLSGGGAPPAEEELTGGQKAMKVMRSLAGVLGGAAYAAGVSGASQNPWAGPNALAQLRKQGVDNEMKRMQIAAMQEKTRRRTELINYMQQNFSDMSDPDQRQAAIQHLVQVGALKFAEQMQGVFARDYGTPAEALEFEREKELELYKSQLTRAEETHEQTLEAKLSSGETPDYTDVSKMGGDYSKAGGAVFKALLWANGRIKAGYNQYLNATTAAEKAVAYQTMVVALNKLLDPQSVVRESEFERTATYQSLENRLRTAWEQVKTGSVSAEVMASIATMGESLMKVGVELQAPVYERFVKRATYFFGAEYGPESVLGGFEDPRTMKLGGPTQGPPTPEPVPTPSPDQIPGFAPGNVGKPEGVGGRKPIVFERLK